MTFATCSCPVCNFSCKQEVKFLTHLVDIHQFTIDKIQDVYDEFVLKQARPACKCGCGMHLPWKGWKKGYLSLTQGSGYLRGHNARDYTAFSNAESIEKMKKTRAEGLKSGRTSVWNDGETKFSNQKIAQIAVKTSATLKARYESGDLVDWHIKDPEKSKSAALKSSQTKKQKYTDGVYTIWNKSLTKETDQRVAKIAQSITRNYEINPSASSKRFSENDVVEKLNLFESLECKTDLKTYKNKYTKLCFECKKCGHQFLRSFMHVQNSQTCLKCKPRESKAQLEIYEFVKSMSPDAILSDRTQIHPRELDIWIPSKNFAIEFNGLFWHSEIFLSDSFHEEKTKTCASKGIKLFHVFEDEWRDKRHIVESMISSRLGYCANKIGARKCEFKQISSAQRKHFFIQNHIDGDAIASVAWGLFHEDELVSAFSLRVPSGKKYNGMYEIARFASKLNTCVTGALSKFSNEALKWVKNKNKNGLMTYVDTRLGDGHGYVSSGFVCQGETHRRFWWVENNKTRVHRLKYAADKKRNMSENEVAEEAGVYRIWGCPNLVLFLE